MKKAMIAHCCVLLLTSLLLVSDIEAGKVLIWPLNIVYSSRINNMCRMGEILKDDGNEVTLLLVDTFKPASPYSVSGSVMYNYTTMRPFALTPEELEYLKPQPDKLDALRPAMVGCKLMRYDCEALLKDTNLTQHLKNKNFDVLISDFFNSLCTAALAEYLNVPVILYANAGVNLEPWIFSPLNLGSANNAFHSIGKSATLHERLFELVDNWITYYVFYQWYVFPEMDTISKKYLNASDLNVKLICSKVKMVLIDSLYSIDYPRPHKPHLKYIGGFQIKETKPLPHNLETFVEGSGEHGIIVMSFGTVFSEELTPELIRIFGKVFSKLRQRILWSTPGITRRFDLPDNVLQHQWLPQNDLLGHPKTRLFITHCGQSATHETMLHGVPVIALPIYFDQFRNAERLCDRFEMGLSLQLKLLTKNDLLEAVINILNNKTYAQNAKKTSALMKDQPHSSKKVLTYWVDYVMRYKGAPQLTDEYISTCDMSLYRYFQIDVLAFIIFVLVCIVVLSIFLFKSLIRLLMLFIKMLQKESKSKIE